MQPRGRFVDQVVGHKVEGLRQLHSYHLRDETAVAETLLVWLEAGVVDGKVLQQPVSRPVVTQVIQTVVIL